MIPLPSSIFQPTRLKIFAAILILVFVLQLASLAHPSTFSRLRSFPIPQFKSYGSTQCLPSVTPDLLKKSADKHAICSKYAPFPAPRTRIATLTAHFGGLKGNEQYSKAFATHLEYALVHGTEVHVLCDSMVDNLWNKPAFILDLLLREMMKPKNRRLEWLVWVDRDTLILDQCRPVTTFLPPSTFKTGFADWWPRDELPPSKDPKNPLPEVNLLAANDINGLNNGVFLLRVSPWAIEMFTAILAYRHYNPNVELRFTEQSAMELVLNDGRFRDNVQIVPQHWFNAYPFDSAAEFATKNHTNQVGMTEVRARRGDWLIHFAGKGQRQDLLGEWANMLENTEDVWEQDRVQRNVDTEVRQFWEVRGFRW